MPFKKKSRFHGHFSFVASPVVLDLGRQVIAKDNIMHASSLKTIFLVWIESEIEDLGRRRKQGNLVTCKKESRYHGRFSFITS